MAGWGKTETGKYPDQLKDVIVPIRNTVQCEKEYRRLSNTNNSRTFDLKSFQISCIKDLYQFFLVIVISAMFTF